MSTASDMAAGDQAERKQAARREASAARKRAAETVGSARAAETVAQYFLEAVRVEPGQVVSGFLPIGSEIDVRPLLARLAENGAVICLPEVVGPGQPLQFRRWREGDPLVEEKFGTRRPGPDAPVVEPDVLLVPGLAFDEAGYRLGYGGGFYDRTLERLRRSRRVTAVGVAYAAQRVPSVPRDPTDQPVDLLVTEAGVCRFRAAEGSAAG